MKIHKILGGLMAVLMVVGLSAGETAATEIAKKLAETSAVKAPVSLWAKVGTGFGKAYNAIPTWAVTKEAAMTFAVAHPNWVFGAKVAGAVGLTALVGYGIYSVYSKYAKNQQFKKAAKFEEDKGLNRVAPREQNAKPRVNCYFHEVDAVILKKGETPFKNPAGKGSSNHYNFSCTKAFDVVGDKSHNGGELRSVFNPQTGNMEQRWFCKGHAHDIDIQKSKVNIS